ncbi:MAG: DUF1351 domain-containing protein [Methanobrevibacter sp.]|nr:DUF1351 domain-containing protein [Methanobrevibacter sp.]
MELVLKSAEINLPKEIDNLEALKAELIPKLEKYNNLVVTADSIKEAKADRAALNKLKTAIDDQRKEIKKQYLEPYNVLENQCKEVLALIDAPIQAIDKQIKAFDNIEENEKYTELTTAFAALEAPEWISLDTVLNPKWKNKTAKTDSLISEMTAKTKELVEGLEKITDMYKAEPYLLSVTEFFKQHKDFSKTAVYAIQMQTAYKKEQEAKATVQNTLQNAPQDAPTVSNDITAPTTSNAVPVNPEAKQPVFKGRFEVEATKEQLNALGAFMKSNGIKFTVIK